MKKKDYINILFIISVAIIVIFSVTRFSNTFGSDTDWINQHTVFPEYLRNMFYSTGKLIPNFSFNYGAGQNIFNISYYGMLSPVVLPSYLFPNISMTAYITIIGFISIFSSIYLFYKWLFNGKYSSKVCFISTIIFALSQPFIFHFHRHIMFVNYMPFLILCLIAIDSLLEKNRKSFLVISLFLTIMTSYYYSVGGIIVIGIYYIYKYFKINQSVSYKNFIKDLIKFGLLIILAILMSSILLLPTIHTIFSGRVAGENTTNLLKLFIPYLKIHKIFCGTYAIGYTMIGFVSLFYLIYSEKRENKIAAILTSIILFIPIFEFLLNGGLYLRPKCFIPFMPLIGLFTTIFINDYCESKIDMKKFVKWLFITSLILYFFDTKQFCFIFLLGIIILLYINPKNKKIFTTFLMIGMFIGCIYENVIEDFISISDYKMYFNNVYKEDIENLLKNDNDIYRISNLMYPVKTVNKIYKFKQLSTSFYTSTFNNYYLNFVRNIFNINNPDFNYFFISSSNNPLFNMFMNVKYVYSDYKIGIGYNEVSKNMYKNDNILPYAYHTNNLVNINDFNKIDYPYNIELLLKNAIVEKGNKKIETHVNKVNLDYKIINQNKDNIQIERNEEGIYINVVKDDKFTIKLSKPLNNSILFINLNGINKNSCSNGNTYITINNIKNLMTCSSWIYQNKNETFHYVISDEELEYFNIEIGKGKYIISSIDTYVLDYDYISNLNENITKFNITNMTDSKIEGTINVNEDGYFITSIPYDKSFIVKANGKNINIETVNTSFLGFKLDKGNYNIEITYKTPLLKEGEIISLISFILLIVLIYYDIKKENKMRF